MSIENKVDRFFLGVLGLFISVQSFAAVQPDSCPKRMKITFSEIKMQSLNAEEMNRPELVQAWEKLAKEKDISYELNLTERSYNDNTCEYVTDSGKRAVLGKKFFFQDADRLWIEEKDFYRYGAGTLDTGALLVSMSSGKIELSPKGATYNDLGYPFSVVYKYGEPGTGDGGDYYDGYLEAHIGYAQKASVVVEIP